MTGFLPFLFFPQSFTIKDATLMSQSLHKHGRKDALREIEEEREHYRIVRAANVRKDEAPIYPEPEGGPSY